MENRWYVVQTKSMQELLALVELRKQGFKVFYPTYTDPKQYKHSKFLEKRLPLFPSYVFVRMDVVKDNWRLINGTRGVSTLVGFTDSFVTPLPIGCIEKLIERADENGNFSVLERAVEQIIDFKPNMELVVDGTAYKGLVGTYCNHSENRVTLLLALLGNNIRVSLPLDAVRPHKM